MTSAGTQVSASAARSLLKGAVEHPFITVALLLALQTLPTLWAKDLWMYNETRHAAVLLQLIDQGHWLVLHLGDQVYPDKPPLYFWLLAVVATILRSTAPHVFMATAALSALLLLLASLAAAKQFGLGRRAILLTGLVLLGNHFFLLHAHMPRMDLLFATFILLSHVSFFKAAAGGGLRTGWLTLAFLAAGLASFTKGPLGALLPIAAFVVFMAYERRLADLASRRIALAALALVVPALAYLLSVYLVAGAEVVRTMLLDHTLQRALHFPRRSEPATFYLLKLPVVLLPWSLLIFLVPWHRIFTRRFLRNLWKRENETSSAGLAYVWISALVNLAIISSFDYKLDRFLLTLLPQAAMLCALAVLRLSSLKRRVMICAIAALLLCAAAILPFSAQLTRWPEQVTGEWIVAAAAALVAFAVLAVFRKGAVFFGMTYAASFSVAAIPFYLVTINGLNPVMSPKELALTLLKWDEAGYRPLYYHPRRAGIFDYHARREIPFFARLEPLKETIETLDCSLLVMRESDWTGWEQKPAHGTVVSRADLDADRMILVRFEVPTSDHACHRAE